MPDTAIIEQLTCLTASIVKRVTAKQKQEGAKHEKRSRANGPN